MSDSIRRARDAGLAVRGACKRFGWPPPRFQLQPLSSRLAGAPAPFDKGRVKIAVVNFTGGGDEPQAFEADAPGVDLRISEGRQDPDAERQLIEQAINLKVKGLIVDNGKPMT